jgi:hypothetical protein
VTGRRDEELGHVEADATGADDGHALAHRRAAQQHIHVAEHRRALVGGDARVAG